MPGSRTVKSHHDPNAQLFVSTSETQIGIASHVPGGAILQMIDTPGLIRESYSLYATPRAIATESSICETRLGHDVIDFASVRTVSRPITSSTRHVAAIPMPSHGRAAAMTWIRTSRPAETRAIRKNDCASITSGNPRHSKQSSITCLHIARRG